MNGKKKKSQWTITLNSNHPVKLLKDSSRKGFKEPLTDVKPE